MNDPVTAARERLERLLPDVLRYDPVSMPAFDQRIDALIEAVRAEAGVSMTLPGSDELARTFHEQYERLAPSFGYVTRRDSSVPWEDVPEPNRSLMLAVATEVLERWPALAARSAGSGSRVEREYDEAVESVHRAFCFPDHEQVGEWDRSMADALRRRGYAIVNLNAADCPTPPPAGSGSLVECGWCNGSGAIMGGQTCLDCHGSGTRPTPPPAGATQVPLPATDSTPPPAVDVHALAESASAQRATKVDAEYHALRAARPTPPPAGATQVPLPATDSTPPPAVDGTRCAECGGVKDDVFHVPCLVGGPFHYVKTCHPFTPPTPAPAVDGTRCGFRLGCGGRPDDPQHQRPFSGWGSMTAHDFEPNTPPAPAPDRLRALEAALERLVTATEQTSYTAFVQARAAARALLADGERSDG